MLSWHKAAKFSTKVIILISTQQAVQDCLCLLERQIAYPRSGPLIALHKVSVVWHQSCVSRPLKNACRHLKAGELEDLQALPGLTQLERIALESYVLPEKLSLPTQMKHLYLDVADEDDDGEDFGLAQVGYSRCPSLPL